MIEPADRFATLVPGTNGLRHAVDVLRGVDGISFTFFTSRDVVRHPLVAKIVRAYEAFEQASDEPPR